MAPEFSSPAGPSALDRYLRLRRQLSERSNWLFSSYSGQLQCRFGCYYCCDNIAVLPIEIEALRRHLSEQGFPAREQLGGPPQDSGETAEERLHSLESGRDRSRDRSAAGTFPVPDSLAPDARGSHEISPRRRCAFLGAQGECSVYPGRPLICRAHGLPLAYRVYEYDARGREVEPDTPEYLDLWCDLNFRDLPAEEAPAYFDRRGRINMDRVNRELERLNTAFLDSPEGTEYRDRFAPGERMTFGDFFGLHPPDPGTSD